MEQIFKSLWELGQTEKDSNRLKIQKGLLVNLAVFMSVGGLVWGTISLMYGLYIQSLIPYGYMVISFFNMLFFYKKKNIVPVRFVQVFISLSLPFLFQFILGGFSSSGVIMLWAVLSLVASMSFQSTGSSIKWLFFYLLLTVVSGLFDDYARVLKPEVLQENSVLFLTVNLGLISSIIFILVGFYMFQYEESERKLKKEKKRLLQLNSFLKGSQLSLKKSINSMVTDKEQVEEQLYATSSSKLEKYGKILAEQQRILSESIKENRKLAGMLTT